MKPRWSRVYAGRYVAEVNGEQLYIMSNAARQIPGVGWAIESESFAVDAARFSDGTYPTLAEAKRIADELHG